MIRIVKFAVVPLILIAGYSGSSQVIATPTLQKAQILPLKAPQSTPHQTAPPNTNTTKRVYLAEKQVSFVPPAGFTPMTAEEIALKFPSGSNQPQYVYANERRSVSIAITFSPAEISPEQLPELKKFLPKFLEQVRPGIKWITQDFTVINKIRWLQLEFISRAIDTNIHNDAYFTSFNGKMLGFNFNSTVEQYDAVSDQLSKSRNSITINQ